MFTRAYINFQIPGETPRRYRFMFAKAGPEDVRKYVTYQRNLDNRLMRVYLNSTIPARKRMVGTIKVPTSAVLSDGTAAYLKTIYSASYFFVQGPGDGSYWRATWLGKFAPKPYDVTGAYYMVPIEIEEIQPLTVFDPWTVGTSDIGGDDEVS